jgi:hypothetical protein
MHSIAIQDRLTIHSSESIERINEPPSFYLTSFSDSNQLASSTTYHKQMCDAARMHPARCSTTNATIVTPFIAREWAAALISSQYVNRSAALMLVRSINTGVDIGFTGDRTMKQECQNLSSAFEHESAVDDAMAKECSLGRRVGPFDAPPFPYYRCSPIGTVEKKRSTKRRIIHHLSWPNGESVNDSIHVFSIKLDAFDRAMFIIRRNGSGCFISKIDIESAYRCIPVRPSDWPLLCMKWRSKYYFDTVLPFGLASATALFEWYSSAAEFITRKLGSLDGFVHYVDDFINITPDLRTGVVAFEFIQKLFKQLGLPIAPDKLEAPSTRVTFLGIVIDTQSMMISLDEKRLAELNALIREWQTKTLASRRDMQSIIGKLAFASKAVVSGRTFLRRMIDNMKLIPSHASADAQYTITVQFRKDLEWWSRFLNAWNGTAIILQNEWVAAEALHIYTDACQAGYSGVSDLGWYSRTWTDEQEALAARDQRDSMPWKEMYALAVAAATWATKLSSHRVIFHCDCQPAVQAWNKGSSQDNELCELIRTILFIASQNSFEMKVNHIAGVDNTFADLLSRGMVQDYMDLPNKPSLFPIIPSQPPIDSW